MRFPHWRNEESHRGEERQLTQLMGNCSPSLVSDPSSHIDKGKKLG